MNFFFLSQRFSSTTKPNISQISFVAKILTTFLNETKDFSIFQFLHCAKNLKIEFTREFYDFIVSISAFAISFSHSFTITTERSSSRLWIFLGRFFSFALSAFSTRSLVKILNEKSWMNYKYSCARIYVGQWFLLCVWWAAVERSLKYPSFVFEVTHARSTIVHVERRYFVTRIILKYWDWVCY